MTVAYNNNMSRKLAENRALAFAMGIGAASLGLTGQAPTLTVGNPNNKIISISRLSDNRTVSTVTPIETSNSSTRRLSWRDLTRR